VERGWEKGQGPHFSGPRPPVTNFIRIFIILVALAIFYSTAYCSTTALQIFIPFMAGCWARCRVPNRITDVSVPSKHMNPPTLLRQVFLKIYELDGRFHNNGRAKSGSDCSWLLESTPATRWYKVRLCRIKTHGSACHSVLGLWTKVMESWIADSSTTA